jgi:hypothetical protein
MAAALLVLVLGIAAAVTHDDDDSSSKADSSDITSTAPTTSPASSSTTTPSTSSTTTTSEPTTEPSSTSTSVRGIPGTTMTVRASVASPEAAANGLIAAYRNGDRAQAQRFATDDVVDVLFQEPYSEADDPGFQGCDPQGTDFLCSYLQPDFRYEMTARGDDAGEFRIVDIEVSST